MRDIELYEARMTVAEAKFIIASREPTGSKLWLEARAVIKRAEAPAKSAARVIKS